jgi:hypothetical protein
MLQPVEEEWNGPPSADDRRRPIGLVRTRLFDVRYPLNHDAYARDDWDQWVNGVWAEVDAHVEDVARFFPAAVEVDGTYYEGLQTRVDDRFLAGAFELPEGWLHVGIERTRGRARDVEFDQVRITRSTDFDRVAWRRDE